MSARGALIRNICGNNHYFPTYSTGLRWEVSYINPGSKATASALLQLPGSSPRFTLPTGSTRFFHHTAHSCNLLFRIAARRTYRWLRSLLQPKSTSDNTALQQPQPLLQSNSQGSLSPSNRLYKAYNAPNTAYRRRVKYSEGISTSPSHLTFSNRGLGEHQSNW